MEARRVKLMLHASAAVFTMAAMAVLALGLALPLTRAMPAPDAVSTEQSTADSGAPLAAPAARGVAQFQAITRLNLRRPLFDPAPAESASVQHAQPASTLSLKLLGVVHEPGHSMAMIQDLSGKTHWLAEGERVDDNGATVTIKRIDLTRVVVEHAGGQGELLLPELEGGEF